MKIFDNKGMMIFPNPKKDVKESEKLIIVKECFCSNGHNLISKKVNFNGFDGIYLKATHNSKKGYIGLSPVFGDNSRVFIDLDVKKGDVPDLYCPHCDAPLPVYSSCSCGGKILALFTTSKLEFANCIGICNKVDCVNSQLINEKQLITISMVDLDPSMFY